MGGKTCPISGDLAQAWLVAKKWNSEIDKENCVIVWSKDKYREMSTHRAVVVQLEEDIKA